MQRIKNVILTDQYLRPIATDIFFLEDGNVKPVIIYAHGFNGFKDWGNFDLVAKQFAQAGFTFVKFNFSFNGTTPDRPEEFVDPGAYAENNYTKELSNLEAVINWASDLNNPYSAHIDAQKIALIGHSRGGGIVLLQAAKDERIRAVLTWASVSECKTPWGSWPPEKMDEWKQTDVAYIANSRTKQQMPLHYQLYEDYQDNKSLLDIKVALQQLGKPLLICHGSEDTSVSIGKAQQLKKWKSDAELFIVPSDHVFGRKHPWESEELPRPMQDVVDRSIKFCEGVFA